MRDEADPPQPQWRSWALVGSLREAPANQVTSRQQPESGGDSRQRSHIALPAFGFGGGIGWPVVTGADCEQSAGGLDGI